jgi:hypothetical protein
VFVSFFVVAYIFENVINILSFVFAYSNCRSACSVFDSRPFPFLLLLFLRSGLFTLLIQIKKCTYLFLFGFLEVFIILYDVVSLLKISVNVCTYDLCTLSSRYVSCTLHSYSVLRRARGGAVY